MTKKQAEQFKRRMRRSRGLCVQCGEPTENKRCLCSKCADALNVSVKKSNQLLRLECFEAYGGPKCARCGESDLSKLEFDHVFGDARVESTKSRRHTYSLMAELRRQGFPDKEKYQVLCKTCNRVKGRKPDNAVPIITDGVYVTKKGNK